MTEQGRFDPAPLGRRILARSGRLARAGGARFASQAVARHRNPTLGRRPRLLPVRAIASPGLSEYAPVPAPGQPVAHPPVAVPHPGGISEEAAKWLFLGELRPNLLPMSALKPAPPPVTRNVARSALPRPRLEEGPSVRSTSAGTPLPRSPQAERRGEAVDEVGSVRGAQPDALGAEADPVIDGGAERGGGAEPSPGPGAHTSEPADDVQPAQYGTPVVASRSGSVKRPSASATLARRAASTPAEPRSAAAAQRPPVPAGDQAPPAIAEVQTEPSAPEAQMRTRTALSREPPKVGDNAEETSAGGKVLDGTTRPELEAAAVPAPVVQSAGPLRRLRPAGPARKVATKASSSVSAEPRESGRAEPEVATGGPTPHAAGGPPAGTDDEAASPRDDTPTEHTAESGAPKAHDVGDGTPLARTAPTGCEAERPTVLARRASASRAGIEPSTGSARVVANAPAASPSPGTRSDERVAAPPGKAAAPPADVLAPSHRDASPVTSGDEPAGPHRKPTASGGVARVVRRRDEAARVGRSESVSGRGGQAVAAPADASGARGAADATGATDARRESEAASTAVRPSVESAGKTGARVVSRSPGAAKASADVPSQLRSAPPDPAPPDPAPPEAASPAPRTVIARATATATATDAQSHAPDPPESEPAQRREVAEPVSATRARPAAPQPTPVRRGGQPVARPEDGSDPTGASGDPTGASGAPPDSEAASTSVPSSTESLGVKVGRVLSRSPDPAPEASVDVPSHPRPAPPDPAPPDFAPPDSASPAPPRAIARAATATDAGSQASDPPESEPASRQEVAEPALATWSLSRAPQPTPARREGAFRLAPARARPRPVGTGPLSAGRADPEPPAAAPIDVAPLPARPDEAPARREHRPDARQSALPTQAGEPVTSASPGNIARSASPTDTTASPASAAAVGVAHGPAAGAPPRGPGRPSTAGSPVAATREPQPDGPASTNRGEAQSPPDAQPPPPGDVPSSSPRAVSRARLSKSTAGVGERLDETGSPGAPELPMPALRLSNAIDEAPAAGAPVPAPDATERPATAGSAAETPGMPAARLRGHPVARRRAPAGTSAAPDAEPPSGEAPSAARDATGPPAAGATIPAPDAAERPAPAGPAGEAPGSPDARLRGKAVARKRASVAGLTAGHANPPVPTSRVPAGPPRPPATATGAPVSTPSHESAPTIGAAEASAANPVAIDAPTPTGTGADPATSAKLSPRSVAAATEGAAGGSVARVTAARAASAPEPTSEPPARREAPVGRETPGRTGTPARTGAPARSPRRKLRRAAVGGPTDPDHAAALSLLPPLRVSGPAVPRVEPPVGFDTHAGIAAPGEAPASRITAGIPGNTRPHVRTHTRVAGPSAPKTAAATVAAGAATSVASAATATASILASEPEPIPSQPYHPLANVPDRPSGQSLARSIGVTRESDGSGRSTVVFPQPPGRGAHPATSRNARPLARQIELASTSLNGHGPDAVPSAAAEPSTYDTGEFDELYDRVLSRLRRDLIVERERRGDLAGAYFR